MSGKFKIAQRMEETGCRNVLLNMTEGSGRKLVKVRVALRSQSGLTMNSVRATVNGVLIGRKDSRSEDFTYATEPVALIGEGAPETPLPSSVASETFFIQDFPLALREPLDQA